MAEIALRWQKKSQYCIQAGSYRISKYTLSGMDLYHVYHGEELIGDASDGNAARRIAQRHSERKAS